MVSLPGYNHPGPPKCSCLGCHTPMTVATLARHQCWGSEGPTLERLYEIGQVEVMPNGCHEWRYGRRQRQQDYGQLPKTMGLILGERRAHRAAYILAIGPIPPGALVTHSCDNRLCINWEHLSAGSHQSNNTEALERGRLVRNADGTLASGVSCLR